MPMPKESEILKSCLDFLHYRGIMAWRNNTMGVYDKKFRGYRKHSGLAGAPDIIGWIVQQCACDRHTVFLGIEVKREEKGYLTGAQKSFLKRLKDDGGVALVVTSVEDLDDQISEFLI